MKSGKGWIERLAEQTDLEAEPFPGQSLVELFGDRRILIENHRGVSCYGTEEICIRVKYGLLCIHGKYLELSRLCHQQLVITGCIESLEIIRGKHNEPK